MIEELGEISAEIGEDSACYDQLLFEEQRCVEEQVEFLYAKEIVAFKKQQHTEDGQEGRYGEQECEFIFHFACQTTFSVAYILFW